VGWTITLIARSANCKVDKVSSTHRHEGEIVTCVVENRRNEDERERRRRRRKEDRKVAEKTRR